MKKGILAGIFLLAGFAGGVVAAGTVTKRMVNSAGNEINLYKNCFNIVCHWMAHKQKGITLDKYLKQKNYHSIAIYGMGTLGGLLYEDLKNSDIEIKYGIDLDSFCKYPGLNIIEPKDKFEEVDAIIVTPVLAFNAIKGTLSSKTEIPIVSIEEVIYEI